MLSIIIVDYFCTQLIENLLQSMRRFMPLLDAEIIVVSNGSHETEKHNLQKHFPECIWLDMQYNGGFARANNAGIQRATGEILLLLNPDMLATDNSLQQCAEMFRQSHHAACGVQLLNQAGEKQISGSNFMKGGLNHLLPIPYYGDFIRWIAYRLNTKPPGVASASAEQKVDWISGAFLMTNRKAIEKAGLLDEDFFLYAEEVEWCSRLGTQGALVIYGDLQMTHLEGGSIDAALSVQDRGYYNLYDRKGLQLMVSNHLRVRKQYGAFWFLFLLLNYTFGLFIFLIVGTLHKVFTLKSPMRVWLRVGQFSKNLLKLWGLSYAILTKKHKLYNVF